MAVSRNDAAECIDCSGISVFCTECRRHSASNAEKASLSSSRAAALKCQECRRLILPSDEIELWRWTQFPGEVFESPGHSPGTLELLNVETGALTLKLADSEHLVQAGSSVLARTEEKHAYTNCGEAELRFVMAVAELQRTHVRAGL